MADMTARERWQAEYEARRIGTRTSRRCRGCPVEPVYGPDDGDLPGRVPLHPRALRVDVPLEAVDDADVRRLRHRPRTRTRRFRAILAAGGDGLSTAFDLPTLMGRDSDDPLSEGEVGKCGVAVDTLADMEDLFAGIDLAEVTTSMTINSPAAVLLAMYVATAEKAGVERAQLGGTLQNDILKEYQAQKEFVFPPRPSMRLVRDTIALRARRRCPGGTRCRSPATTSARPARPPRRSWPSRSPTASPTWSWRADRAGCRRVRPPPQLLLQRPHRLLRGDRQVPRRPPHLGPLDEGPLRRPGPALAHGPVPHPDRGRLADRPAARDQRRPHRHRGAGRRAGRDAEPPHRTPSTRRSPCRPRRRPASRCGPSR